MELNYKWPATKAFLENRELDYWIWTYLVWCGSTYWVLEGGIYGPEFLWFHTDGANPKFRKSA